MTQELRKLAKAATVGVWKASGFSVNSKEHGWATIANTELDYDGMAENAAYIAAASPAAILALLDRVEKAERLLFELREAAAAVVSNEEHAFSGGMRKYAEGSQTWQVYEDLRIAMEASK